MEKLRNVRKELSLSVIICTRNRSKDLAKCMNSIMIQTHIPNEIVIVDSSDDKSTRRLIERYVTNDLIPIKYLHTSPGLTRQRNIGISESWGKIVAFLDDDIILDQEYFFQIMKCFETSHDVFGVGGSDLNVARISLLAKCFRKLFMLTVTDGKQGVIKRSGLASFQIGSKLSEIDETEILCGCSCYRREVFQKYTFDEYFEGYGFMEDVDFSYRVSRQHRLLYTPLAKFIHNHSPSGRLDLRKLHEMQVFNHYYVFIKNIKKSCIDWVFFWWSEFGVLLRSFITAIRIKNVSPLVGMYMGHKKAIMNIIRS